MAAFEIKNSGLTLEIGGGTFTVYPDDADYIEKVERFSREAQRMSTEFSGMTEGISDKIREVCVFCLNSIDELLGEGASEKIFGDQHVGMMMCLEVLIYIKVESERYMTASRQRIRQMGSNREQRRKAQKK